MNSYQAKQLSLPSIMAKLGYIPAKVIGGGAEFWYLSPFRKEKTPSFHTSFLGGKWIWNDFGDEGGTVIDFVMRHEGFTRVKDALKFLDQAMSKSSENLASSQHPCFPFQQQGRKATRSKTTDLTLLRTTPISNPVIHRYLEEERCLPRYLVDRYLTEVIYRNEHNAKEYFAFGMQNRSGGYEIRSASDKYRFKSVLNGRDITIVPGRTAGQGVVNLFEGILDFLSLMAMLGVQELPEDSIVMHSLSSFDRTTNYLQTYTYREIHIYLDNDQPGKDCAVRFQRIFPGKIVDRSEIYAPHLDLNEALVRKSTPSA
mgnify:CR=1 FL=1